MIRPNEIVAQDESSAELALYYRDGSRRDETFLIDAADLEWVQGNRWSCAKGRYVFRSKQTDRGSRTEFLHRVILDDPEGLVIDHINGNGLDNRRDNLRAVTQQQNSWNTTPRSQTATGRRGVREHGGLFIVSISLTFRTVEEAIAQREAWESTTWGDFKRQPA